MDIARVPGGKPPLVPHALSLRRCLPLAMRLSSPPLPAPVRRRLQVNRARPSLVLSDPNLHFASPGAAAAARNSGFQRRPPRSREEAQRRQELTRVADELRSVLALRSSGSEGGGGGGKGSS